MKRTLSTIASGLALTILLPTAAQAWDWGKPGHDRDHDRDGRGGHFTPRYLPPGRVVRELPGNHVRLIIGGVELSYWDGLFYRLDGGQYTVVTAPVGTVVTAIPTGYPPVIIDGVPYYTINGVTYMQTSFGYQVVPPPTAITTSNVTVVQTAPAAPPPPPAADTYVVNIPNARGTYTAVTLKRAGNGFIGPQGEYYPEFPRVDQLKLMYAK